MSRVDLRLLLKKSEHTLLDVDLSLPGRGVCGIIGFSGAGKTTLLRAVAGLEREVKGRVVINEEVWQDDAQNIFLPTHRRPIGYVFQEPSLFGHLTVLQNLEFGLRRIPTAHQKVSLSHVTDLLGIAGLLERLPSTLSGGEKQRVGIARALATSPQLLLMDEPLASLDAQRKAEVLPYLERLHTELEIPVLYVSHATEEVEHLADHIVMLELGRVRAQGEMMDVLMRADLPFVHGDQAFVLVCGKVVGHDVQYQLSEVEFAGGTLWLPQSLHAVGDAVRIRLCARDVSLSLERQIGSSILNSLAVTILSIDEDAPGLMMVTLDSAGTKLLARISKKSADQLSLHAGMAIYAQIKSAAIK